MARRTWAIGVALAAIGMGAPAAAQNSDGDVRCLLASNAFAQRETEPAKKQLAMVASAFYLGRLDARISNDQLKNAVQAQAKAMSFASLAPTMNDCVKRLQQKGLALRAMAGPAGVRQPPRAPTKPK